MPYRDEVAEAAQREIERRGHFAVVVPATGPATITAAFAPEAGADVRPGVQAPTLPRVPLRGQPDGGPRSHEVEAEPLSVRTFLVPRHEAVEKLDELRGWLDGLLGVAETQLNAQAAGETEGGETPPAERNAAELGLSEDVSPAKGTESSE